MVYPPGSLTPVRVAEMAGVTTVWLSGIASRSLLLHIRDLPFSNRISATVVGNGGLSGVPVTATSEIVGRYGAVPSANLSDVLGIGVVTVLSIIPPSLNLGPGLATLTISATEGGGATQQASLALQYFQYPAPTVSIISPSSGPLGGANFIR